MNRKKAEELERFFRAFAVVTARQRRPAKVKPTKKQKPKQTHEQEQEQ